MWLAGWYFVYKSHTHSLWMSLSKSCVSLFECGKCCPIRSLSCALAQFDSVFFPHEISIRLFRIEYQMRRHAYDIQLNRSDYNISFTTIFGCKACAVHFWRWAFSFAPSLIHPIHIRHRLFFPGIEPFGKNKMFPFALSLLHICAVWSTKTLTHLFVYATRCECAIWNKSNFKMLIY